MRDLMKSATRRDALRTGGLAAVAGMAAYCGLIPLRAAASPIRLGERSVEPVSDGHLTLPMSYYMPDAPKEEVAALLAANGLPIDQVQPPCNATLLRDGDRLVLFDAGSGPNFMSSAGRLVENLEAMGVAADAVTDVVFTHGHPDHLWGVLDDFEEEPFVNAAYHFGAAEFDYWRAEGTLAATPEARKSFVVGAQNRLAAIEERVSVFKGGDEVLPGIEAVDTPGHTPGHVSFVVHGGGEAVTIIGDAIVHPVISFAHPEWRAGSDQDPDLAIATRKMLLDRLAAGGTQVIGFHLTAPGAGRVERSGNAYRFVAAG